MKITLRVLATLALTLALVSLAYPSEGTWMFVGETEFGPVLVEKESISQVEGNYRYWSKSTNFWGEGADLWEYNDLDCQEKKVRVLQASVYKRDGSSEPVTATRKWKFIEPGSTYDTIRIMLCQ